MDLALSEEQKMLQKVARDFLSNHFPKSLIKELEASELGYLPELWKEMAKLGWMGLPFPEDYGGAGMKFLDLAVLLEEMGRACLTGPYFSTVILGGLPILDEGSKQQKEEFLPRIASGDLILTLALTEPTARYDAAGIQLRAESDMNGYVLSGLKLFVPDAHVADYILCVARTAGEAEPEEGISIFIVDAKSAGINYTLLRTIAGDKLCEVSFEGTKVPPQNVLGKLNYEWSEVEHIVERAAVAKCCEMVGGMQQVLELTTNYAKERVQYGRPIGSFQAIQHYLADMAIDVDGSRLSTYRAAWMLSEGLPCSRAIAVAKVWTSEAYQRVVALAHQIHGGLGFTIDYDLHFYFRRATAAAPTFGGPDFYRQKMIKCDLHSTEETDSNDPE